METRSSKLNKKRQRQRQRQNENENPPPPHPQRKSQRLLNKSQQPPSPPDSSDEPMKIIDLNDDCLKKIFGYLDQRSLFNVAVSNEWLRPAAGVTYKCKFGTKIVCINNSRYLTFGWGVYNSGNQIIVTGFKLCLQYLRCLGSSISSLSIWCDNWNEKQSEFICQYINKYCVKSLAEIRFHDKSKWIPIKEFGKPFVNVRAVKVYASDLRNQLPSFAEWFPNMRSLKLDGVRTLRCIDTPIFHRLEDLSISIECGEYSFTVIKVTSLLQQLPQLNSLSIGIDDRAITLNTVLNMIKNNRSICNLKVNMVQNGMAVTASNIQQLVNEHPLLIELELVGFRLSSDAVMLLIREMNLLKKFGLQIVSRWEYDRLVSQLDGQWRSSFHIYEHSHCIPYYVQLER